MREWWEVVTLFGRLIVGVAYLTCRGFAWWCCAVLSVCLLGRPPAWRSVPETGIGSPGWLAAKGGGSAPPTEAAEGEGWPGGRVGTVLVRPLPAREWDARTVRALREYLTEKLEADVAEGGDRAELVGMFGGLEAWRRRIEEEEYDGPIPLIAAMETTWEGNIWVLRTPAREAGVPRPVWPLIGYLLA